VSIFIDSGPGASSGCLLGGATWLCVSDLGPARRLSVVEQVEREGQVPRRGGGVHSGPRRLPDHRSSGVEEDDVVGWFSHLSRGPLMAQDPNAGPQPAGRNRLNRHRFQCLVTWRRETSDQVRPWLAKSSPMCVVSWRR